MLRLLPLGFALAAVGAYAETLAGRVVNVADGDTLTVLDAAQRQHKVRLADIDAPEKGQAFGQRARESLAALCAGQPAEVEQAGRDRYGRVVGRVTCARVLPAETSRCGAWLRAICSASDFSGPERPWMTSMVLNSHPHRHARERVVGVGLDVLVADRGGEIATGSVRTRCRGSTG